MRSKLRNYLVLWFATLILAFLAERVFYGCSSIDFWMATSSIPTPDGRSISVPRIRIIPLNEVWYYLILSLAGGVTLAKILAIIAQSAIAQNWKRALAWLSGLLCATVSTYSISCLAYSAGVWQKIGLVFFYNSSGSIGPTIVFAIVVILAELLSNAAFSEKGKKRLFFTLSGMTIASVLLMYMIPVFAPKSPMDSHSTYISLLILDGLMYVASVLVAVVAAVKLVASATRRVGRWPGQTM